MSPRVHRVFLPIFLAGYAVAGFLTHSRFGGREVFPVFSWGLYADAPRREVQYTVLVSDIDGTALPYPVDILVTPEFHRAPDYWRDAGVLGRFGAALEAGDRERTEPLRRLVEANILRGERVRYEVVKRTYDPLERRATGAFTEASLGQFVKDSRAGTGR